MVGYGKHRVSNIYLVKKIIRARSKPDGNMSEISSQIRRLNSPRSLQAGPFGFRGNSVGSFDFKPAKPVKATASVESRREIVKP
jgi:hypothetical protein